LGKSKGFGTGGRRREIGGRSRYLEEGDERVADGNGVEGSGLGGSVKGDITSGGLVNGFSLKVSCELVRDGEGEGEEEVGS